MGAEAPGMDDALGMRSWSKWKIFSRKWWSSSKVGPRRPTFKEFWSSETGVPCWVVSTGTSPPAT